MNKKLISTLVLIVAIDQFSKYLVVLLGFDIVLNKGISLNLLNFISTDLMTLLLIFLVLLVFFIFKKDQKKHPVVLGLFFGGAVSNIMDRILYGAVRDWLKIPFLDVQNNLADWFIFLGLVVFLLSLFKDDKIT